MDDLYYYGWVLDVDDDVCVRGVGGVYITFRDVLCWVLAGFFFLNLLLLLLLPFRNGFFDAPRMV
jgi:hypothetical protein